MKKRKIELNMAFLNIAKESSQRCKDVISYYNTCDELNFYKGKEKKDLLRVFKELQKIKLSFKKHTTCK